MAPYPSSSPPRARLSAAGPRRRGFGALSTALALLAVGTLAWRSGAIGFIGGAKPVQAAGAANHDVRPRGGKPSPRPPGSRPGTPAPSQAPSVAAGPAAQRAEIQRLLSIGRPVYCGGGTKPLVALTFDDGPGPYTEKTLRILHAAGARATFFLVGKLVVERMYQGIPRLEAKANALGDHTWNHVVLTGLSDAKLRSEVVRTEQVVHARTGAPVWLFRPPTGRHDVAVDRVVRSSGMIEVLWSVDSQDSLGAKAQKVLRNVRKGLRPGAIILLHENRGTTLQLLPEILREIRARGLHAVTVPELLTLDPPSAEQLRSGSCP